MSVVVTGVDSTVAALYHKAAKISSAVDKNIRAGAIAVKEDAIDSIQGGMKTGFVYPSAQSKTHQASAPGEAPATDTGHLVASIMAVKNISGDGSWLVGSGLDYAKYLEFGTTQEGGRLSPRPWLMPALEKNRNWIYKNIERAVREQLK